MLPVLTLIMDAARVIELRLRMMAFGKSTPDEMIPDGIGEDECDGGSQVDHYQKRQPVPRNRPLSENCNG
jgi:hypothetical protein